jgi:hypothetical protein
LSALGRIILYAAVGVGITYGGQARRYLVGGVVALAAFEVICYLPSVGDRLYGVIVADPAQVGFLFVAAALLVLTSRAPLAARLVLGIPLLAGVAASMTRSVWFALGVVGVAACLPRRWYLSLILPPVLAVAALPFVSTVTELFGLNRESAEIRQRSIEAGLSAFLEHPVTGHGWAFTSRHKELGYFGLVDTPTYNLWIFLGTSVGVVGVALFAVFVALLSREVLDSRPAYLTIFAMLALALTETPLYGGSLVAVLFFTLTALPSDATTTPGRGLFRARPQDPAQIGSLYPK